MLAVPCANPANQRVTVIFGHADIGHDYVRAPAIVCRKSFLDRGGRHNKSTVTLQQDSQKIARIRVVFNNQDADAFERDPHNDPL